MNTAIHEAGPFHQFKARQRDIWGGFGANESFTTVAAGVLVAFARVRAGETVLDVGCGTGVVAVAAARAAAHAKGLDLTPILLERARENALIAGVDIEFTEGDAEALPYADASFDVVLSQFGHMFAPRPEVATAEMLRVLKPGGRIAFTTWPPEHVMGQFFTLIGRNMPAPPSGAPVPAPPVLWGDPGIVRERLGDRVFDLRFGRSTMDIPALSANHAQLAFESSFGPLKMLLASLEQNQPERAASVRAEIVHLVNENMEGSVLRQIYLMSCATKNAW
ncbi:methyltransferase type 11 [Capsulimonas corticalis]|uniref:Methyltransferase type 11 n=1 Tax=Capsulimonas corticalis TaxID=2219043 RepID=A0A402CUX8_9BACT|nr:class I SAM-dependent methyltransferase [Capsulimonas corticalis]BDI29116.1 methyltransferase type 11 [Capsulimonas corticalis]